MVSPVPHGVSQNEHTSLSLLSAVLSDLWFYSRPRCTSYGCNSCVWHELVKLLVVIQEERDDRARSRLQQSCSVKPPSLLQSPTGHLHLGLAFLYL